MENGRFSPTEFDDWVGKKMVIRNFEKGTPSVGTVVEASVLADGKIAKLTIETEEQ